jgi:hypothetical protein
MKYIKSLAYLIVAYVLIVALLSVFGGWSLTDALSLIRSDNDVDGNYISAFLITSILISTSFSSSIRPHKKFWGYFAFPFISAFTFILFSLFMSGCGAGMMGCGFNLLVAIVYAFFIYILCIVNFWLSVK